MLDPEMNAATGGAESPEERRTRQAADDVAAWDAAFAAAKARSDAPSNEEPDRANAGALVSRAHREEKTSGSSPHAVGPNDRSARRTE